MLHFIGSGSKSIPFAAVTFVLKNVLLNLCVGVWQSVGNFVTGGKLFFFSAQNCKLDLIVTYVLNLDIPPKIFRGVAETYFRETLFSGNGCHMTGECRQFLGKV